MADQCEVSRCHDPNCRMPLPNRYYHAFPNGNIDQRFCSGRCLRNWRRYRTGAVSALQAALSIEASRDREPEDAHSHQKAEERIEASAAIALTALGLA